MKKIIIFFFLLTAIGFTQTWSPKSSNVDGKYREMKTAGGDTIAMLVYTAGGDTVPITLTGTALVEEATLYAKYLRGATDTVANVMDTLTRKIMDGVPNTLADLVTKWWNASIIADDTIEVCTASSFPGYQTVLIYPGEVFVSGIMQVATVTNLYIRRYNVSGEAGTPRYRIAFRGY